MLSLPHSQLTRLTSARLGAGAAAALGAGAGGSGWQSGQYMMASNCVSASQRTRLSRESGPLKSDSHSGKGAPKGSSCSHMPTRSDALHACRPGTAHAPARRENPALPETPVLRRQPAPRPAGAPGCRGSPGRLAEREGHPEGVILHHWDNRIVHGPIGNVPLRSWTGDCS